MKVIRIIIVALGLVKGCLAHEETRDIEINDVRRRGEVRKMLSRSLSSSEIGTAEKLDHTHHGRRLPGGKGGKGGGACTSQTTLLNALYAINTECTGLQSAITTALSQIQSLVPLYCELVTQITTTTSIPSPIAPTVIPAGKGKGKGATSSTGFYVAQLESFFQEVLLLAQQIDALYVNIKTAETTIASAQSAMATLESQRIALLSQCAAAGVALSTVPVSTCILPQTNVIPFSPTGCT